MTRWLTILLLLCCTTSPLAEGKKEKKKLKNPPPVAGEKEDESRVVLAFDPGSHTRRISALGFNKDQSKLITVGWDYTIQIWSAKTGERLDIIRLPAYGRDNGFDSNRWHRAAISADGTLVAIGGGPKLLYGDKGIPTRLLVVDVEKRQVRKLFLPGDPKTPVTCLAFSANGDRLAVGTGGTNNSVYVLDNVIQTMRNAPEGTPSAAPQPVVHNSKFEPEFLALSPTGNRLLIEDTRFVTAWNISGKTPEAWKNLGQFKEERTGKLEWAPDESHYARSWTKGAGEENRGIELRSPNGEIQKSWSFSELEPGFSNQAIVGTFRYLAADRLFISANGGLGSGDRFGALGVLLDPQTGKTIRRFAEESHGMFNPIGTASPSGTLAATTTSKGLEAVIYDLADGKVVARCGSRTPVPTIVGWSKDPEAPAIAWSDNAALTPDNSTVEQLKFAFDLAKIEPVSLENRATFDLRRLTHDDWKLAFTFGAGNFHNVYLKQGEQEIAKLTGGLAITLVPNGKEQPLFARSINANGSVYLLDGTGKHRADLLPAGTYVRDMVSSPDGRYLLLSTGTHRLSIYRTDGSNFPFLNLVQVSGEWVAWTPEGYYAASPGGERLIGWAENKGANEFAVFHPAEKFAKRFRRPDIIKLAFEKGSLSEALEELQTEAPAVEKILPPECSVKLLSPPGRRVLVETTVIAAAADQPVVGVRLFLNGSALILKPKSSVTTGLKEVSTWELDVPSGPQKLTLMARSEESKGFSEPVMLVGPKTEGEKRVLHRLCVGISNYAIPEWNLMAAAKDAKNVFAALEEHCVGVENQFDLTRGTLLTDERATRQEVGKAIVEIRKVAKPGDLVVFMFAGHGIKKQDEYYLLTHEGDPSENLKGKSLSGADLRNALTGFECPVLLVLDSCFATKAVKAFRPATDDLTRSLTEDTMKVTILSAAMAHEKAKETEENGHFTAAFLKALKLSKDTPYDRYDNLLYTHHIYDVIYSEVRKATDDQQTPFLHRPTTMQAIAVRRVPRE